MPLPFNIPRPPNRSNPNQDENRTYDGSTNPYVGGYRTRGNRSDSNDDAGDVSSRSSPIPPQNQNVSIDADGILSDEGNDEMVNRIFHQHTFDDYTQTKYNIEFSLLGGAENVNTGVDDLKRISERYFIASSDITGADEEYNGNQTNVQFFVKSLNFKTINSLSIANPETPNSAMFTMEIEEPYGFSLDKMIRRAANDLGYSSAWPANRFIFRLDIWFSGYRNDGEFVERIPVVNPYPVINVNRESQGVPPISPDLEGNADYTETYTASGQYSTEEKFTFFVHVIQIESELSNGTSTNYKLQMLPVQDIPMYPEYDTLNYLDLGIGVQTGNNTFGEYIDEMTNYLNEFYTWYPNTDDGLAQSTSGTPLRIYEFDVPDELRDATFDFLPETNNEEEAVAVTRLGAQGRSIRSDLFEKITFTEAGRSSLLSEEYPKEIYTVRARLDYSASTDAHMDYWGDLTNVKVIYYIEKKKEYRYNPANMRERTTWSQSAEARAREIIASGALKKIYKYVFSGDNTVVKSFDLKANVFWNHITSSASDDFRYNSADISIDESDSRTAGNSYQLFSPTTIDNTLTEIRGNANLYSDDHIFPARRSMNAANILGYSSTANADDVQTNETLYGYSLYQEQLENRLRLSSVVLEGLEIRGEPQWLSSIYSLNENQIVENADAAGIANSLATDIIYLKLLYPDQREYMNPDSDVTRPILLSANYGGFFQIISVDHKFEGGLYSQSLQGHRLSQEISQNSGRLEPNE